MSVSRRAGGRRARQLVWLDGDHVLLVAQFPSPQPDGAAAEPSSSVDQLLVVDLADGSVQSGKLCPHKLLFLPLLLARNRCPDSGTAGLSAVLSCAAEVQLPPGQQVLRALPAEGPAPALLQLQNGKLVEFRDGALAQLTSSSFPAPSPLMARVPAGAAGGHLVPVAWTLTWQPTADRRSHANALL